MVVFYGLIVQFVVFIGLHRQYLTSGNLLLVSLLIFGVTFEGVEHEKKLQEFLINNYNRLVRPVEKNSDRLVVKLGLKLIQILDVDEKNQVLTTNVWLKHIWKDINLKWNPADYGNLTSVAVPSSSIWIPDIILYNSADGKYEITLMTRAKIDYEGNVHWDPPAIYKSSCTINVEFFPFDQQHCAMKFGSWTYDGQQVDLVHISQTTNKKGEVSDDNIPIGMDLQDFYQSHEWDVMSVPAKRNVVYAPLSKEFYPDITFNITLRRKTLFYTCNLIIPCVGISFLTVLTFYLPSESGEKISLCISILLSLTVFVLLLNDLIPPTSLVVPLIGKYLSFTFILVSLSVLVTVVVLNVHFRSPNTHEMPMWTKSLFLYVLPKILLMKRPPITSTVSASHNLRDYAESFLNDNEKLRLDEKKQKRSAEARAEAEMAIGGVKNKHQYLENLDPRLETFTLIENQPRQATQQRRQQIDAATYLRSKILAAKRERLIMGMSSWSLGWGRKNSTANKLLSRDEFQLLEDKLEAIEALNNIVSHLKSEHQENRIRQEWRYTALVIDRLLLVIFTTSCIVGTISIILQAPSFYDKKTPIDQIMSRQFK